MLVGRASEWRAAAQVDLSVNTRASKALGPGHNMVCAVPAAAGPGMSKLRREHLHAASPSSVPGGLQVTSFPLQMFSPAPRGE